MLKWLMALIASSFTFALADVLCDVCITESEAEAQTVETAADDDELSDQGSGIELSSCSGHDAFAAELQQTPMPARYKALPPPSTKSIDDIGHAEQHEEDAGISGAQDAAIAGVPHESKAERGSQAPAAVSAVVHRSMLALASAAHAGLPQCIVTTVGLLFSIVYWLLPSKHATDAIHVAAATVRSKGTLSLKWWPTTHLQWWLAVLGGASAFMHYFFLLKAFEGAPSTVLLPLVQVASVSVLLGSSVVALYRHEPWITSTHALAYVLMFVGGILPACAGQLTLLLSRSFWRQTFVGYAIAAELALGLHDLMLSGTAYNSANAHQQQQQQQQHHQQQHMAPAGAIEGAGVPGALAGAPPEVEENAESFEFFLWSRCSFIVTFLLMYLCSPVLYDELKDLLSGRISKKYVALSAISEGLTIVGFYLASIAYGLFYQAGIVHAAEASLSQLMNLMLAYLLLRGFGIGRTSAVSSMTIKLVSFVMVTIGLFLCTVEESRPAQRVVPAASRADLRQLPGTEPPGAATQMASAVAMQATHRLLRRRL